MTALPWLPGAPQFLDLGGVRVDTLALGPPPDAAPTLVLLHEGLGCVALWRDVPQSLAQATGCGVFLYSRQGYGRSSPVALPRPLDYMTREAVETLPAVLDAVRPQKLALIGHSDGATIAAIHAGARPHPSLAALALIAPHFFSEPEGLAAIRAARQAYEQGDLKPRLAKYHDDPDGAFYGWAGAWLDPGFRAWNVADAIDRWRVPALVVQGDADPYGTLAQVEEVQRRAPAEALILQGVKHAPQFEAPDATRTALARFLRERLS